MRVLFCGDREWGRRESQQKSWREVHAVEAWLLKLRQHTDVIVHGGARGADTVAGELAAGMGFEVEVFTAEWGKFGRAAGPRRNAAMLKSGVDLVVAFHPDLRRSKGTADMVRQARKAGVRVVWVNSAGKEVRSK